MAAAAAGRHHQGPRLRLLLRTRDEHPTHPPNPQKALLARKADVAWLQLGYQDTVTRLEGVLERVERPRSAASSVSLPELSGLGHCADAAFGMPSQLPNDRACADGQGGSRRAARSRPFETKMELIRDERWLNATRSGAKAPHGPSTPATTPPNSPAPSRALRGRWRGRERSRPSCSRGQLRKAARRAEGVLLPARAAYAPGNLPPWPPQHPQRALRPAPAPPSESQFAIGGRPGTADSVVLSGAILAGFGW